MPSVTPESPSCGRYPRTLEERRVDLRRRRDDLQRSAVGNRHAQDALACVTNELIERAHIGELFWLRQLLREVEEVLR